MPSIRTLLASFLAVSSIQLSSASPLPADLAADCEKPTPTIPSSGNNPDLPITNLTLVAVAIGRGVQNYTCAAVGAVPSSIGAIATLYDATSLAYASESTLHKLPALAVYMPLPSASKQMAISKAVPALKPMGNHYFDKAGTPTFNLSSLKKILFGMKTGHVTAPATADKGPAGTGAVDWLQLSAKPAPYTSVGTSQVYRVVTAGGSAPKNCTDTNMIVVQYAAEYWFYN